MDYSFQKNGFLKENPTKIVNRPVIRTMTPFERMEEIRKKQKLNEEEKPLDEKLGQQHKIEVLKELGRFRDN